jgi:hypothetical protein
MGLDPAEDNTFVADDSREYIVSGNITIDAEFVEDAAIGTRLNNVLARIASVIIPDDGTGVTIDSGSSATKGVALVLTSMAFVDGPVSLEGHSAIDASALAALTSTLTLKQGGDIAFPSLNQTGDVRLAATTTITSLDLSNVTTGDVISTADGVLSDPSLAGDVDLGKLDLPPSVSLDAATSITAGGAPNGVVISALKATAINLVDTTPFAVTGAISITAEGAITLNAKSITGSLTITSTKGSIALNDLTSVGSVTTLAASTTVHVGLTANAGGTTASGSEVHLASLASNAGGLTIDAPTIDLTSLAANTSLVTITTATALSLDELASNAATITAAAVKTFSAAKLGSASITTIDIADGAAVTMLNLSANASNTTPLEDFDTLLSLTLLEQSNNVDFSDAASMTSLDYTGKKLYSSAMDQQTNQVTITNDLLTTLTIGNGYVGTLHVT